MDRQIIRPEGNDVKVHCAAGDILIVRLEAVPGNGYSWIVENKLTNSSLNTESLRFVPFHEESKPGSLEEQELEFRVDSEGFGLIMLAYCRPCEGYCHTVNTIEISLLASRSEPRT
jgi:predicted secreted protein